jgi:hypothetical protein
VLYRLLGSPHLFCLPGPCHPQGAPNSLLGAGPLLAQVQLLQVALGWVHSVTVIFTGMLTGPME